MSLAVGEFAMKKPRRQLLSQNFLHDRKLVAKLVRRSSIGKTDTVLEIGPGKGIITEALLEKAMRVVAVEIDSRLFEKLKTKFSQKKNLKLIQTDFLDFPLPKFPYKVFANLPFRISSDIVRRLLDAKCPPEESYLIVQKEAAEKLTGESLISVLYHPWFEFSIIHHFRRDDFAPRPGVDVVLLKIVKRINPLISDSQKREFQDFVSYVFSRKKPYVFKLTQNPSEIIPEKWLNIFGQFTKSVAREKRLIVKGAYNKTLADQQKLQKIHRTRQDKN